jgi:hypothetical protein
MQHEEIKEEVILTLDTLLDAYFVYFFLLNLWNIKLGLQSAFAWLFCWKVFAVTFL